MTGFLKRLTLIPVISAGAVVELLVWMVSGREPGWFLDPYLKWLEGTR